ncbi:MAG: hypothetical protein JSV21_09335 [Nitrospirota bacterium]|nr:MAG: hypothetical protein JSV21_09335 [Nitrospirota bacterium]
MGLSNLSCVYYYMYQLELAFPDRVDISRYLESKVNRKILLKITDNTSSMISYRYETEKIILRLHRMFLTAGTDVLDEIALFIKGKNGKAPVLSGFIKDNGSQIVRGPSRRLKIRTRGKHHDLRSVFDNINACYFNNRIKSKISWGPKGPRRYARSRTLGSYVESDDIIRINSILDSRSVPKYYLAFVVYHEMLHADIGISGTSGRRSVHSNEFRRREKMFEFYARAIKWEGR